MGTRAAVSFSWDGTTMTARPPDPATLRTIARKGRAAKSSLASIAVGLELLAVVLDAADYAVIKDDLAAGGDSREMAALVRYLAGMWAIDPRSVAESN